jgi:hypothetical protein
MWLGLAYNARRVIDTHRDPTPRLTEMASYDVVSNISARPYHVACSGSGTGGRRGRAWRMVLATCNSTHFEHSFLELHRISCLVSWRGEQHLPGPLPATSSNTLFCLSSLVIY